MVVLHALDHAHELGLAQIGGGLGLGRQRHRRDGVRQGAIEEGFGFGQGGFGTVPGGGGGDAVLRVDRGGEGEFVADVVEHGEDGRANEDRVGEAELVAVLVRDALHLADHVVA